VGGIPNVKKGRRVKVLGRVLFVRESEKKKKASPGGWNNHQGKRQKGGIGLAENKQEQIRS